MQFAIATIIYSTLQAYGVAVIAHWDWPEAWPQLLPGLEAALGSGEPPLVHGAMRVLAGTAAAVGSGLPHQTCVVMYMQSSVEMYLTWRYLTWPLSSCLNCCECCCSPRSAPGGHGSWHTPFSPLLLQIYSVRTQSRAVHIFHTLSSIIYVASETTPILVTSLLLPALPQFIVGLWRIIIIVMLCLCSPIPLFRPPPSHSPIHCTCM